MAKKPQAKGAYPGGKAKLGSGARFAGLKKEIAKGGARNPGAVAASIGRKKYGAKGMAKMAAAGRKKGK